MKACLIKYLYADFNITTEEHAVVLNGFRFCLRYESEFCMECTRDDRPVQITLQTYSILFTDLQVRPYGGTHEQTIFFVSTYSGTQFSLKLYECGAPVIGEDSVQCTLHSKMDCTCPLQQLLNDSR